MVVSDGSRRTTPDSGRQCNKGTLRQAIRRGLDSLGCAFFWYDTLGDTVAPVAYLLGQRAGSISDSNPSGEPHQRTHMA